MPASRPKRPATILVVDDDPFIRATTAASLRGRGFTILQAGNGQEGLDKATTSDFDMIVTDLNMPIMDGLTMIRELRKSPAHCGIPIIFLTTESDDAMKQQARAAGATGWLVKPFVPDQLIRIARKVLGR